MQKMFLSESTLKYFYMGGLVAFSMWFPILQNALSKNTLSKSTASNATIHICWLAPMIPEHGSRLHISIIQKSLITNSMDPHKVPPRSHNIFEWLALSRKPCIYLWKSLSHEIILGQFCIYACSCWFSLPAFIAPLTSHNSMHLPTCLKVVGSPKIWSPTSCQHNSTIAISSCHASGTHVKPSILNPNETLNPKNPNP